MDARDKNTEENTGKNIGKNIGILCRQMNLFLNHELRDYDISATEIMYLGSLFIKDGVSQEELVKEFYMDKAAVARTIGSLEDKNLVIRKCSETDKRSKKVFLTEKAGIYKDILNSIQNKWYREVLGNIDRDRMSAFAESLDTISENMRKINEK